MNVVQFITMTINGWQNNIEQLGFKDFYYNTNIELNANAMV